MRMRAVRFEITVVTLSWMTLLLLMLTLTIPPPSHAAVFFDTSFETCVVGGGASFPCEGWNDFDQEAAGVIGVATDQVFSGSKSFKQTLTKADGDGNLSKPSIFKSFPAGDHAFFRWANKWSVPFQACTINGQTKFVRLKTNLGYPLIWIVNHFGSYAMLFENSYGGGNPLLTTGVPVTTGKWDQLEVEWKLNTPGQANGLLRFWINGALKVEVLNKEMRGPTPTSVNPTTGAPMPSTGQITNTQIYVQCGAGNVWYDRFAVGNTRIGLATSQTSSDTAPPVIPLGVQVR